MINPNHTLQLLEKSLELVKGRETIKQQAAIIIDLQREIRSLRGHLAYLEMRLLPEITPSQKAFNG